MKKLNKAKTVLQVVVATFITTLAVVSISLAASTIGANITTAGTLAVTDTSTLTGAVTTGAALTVGTDLTVTSDLAVTGDSALTGTLAVTGATAVETFTQGGGVLTTTTPASMTLAAGDFDVENFIDMEPTVGAITITLPATSTMSAIVPNVGDSRKIFIRNSTTTAATTLTLATGTGWDLQTSTSTAIIYPEDFMVLEFFRQSDTDITGSYNTTSN